MPISPQANLEEHHGAKAKLMRDFIVESHGNAFVIAEKDLKKPNSKSEYPFYEMKKAHSEGDDFGNHYNLVIFDMITVYDQNRWPWEFMNNLKDGRYGSGKWRGFHHRCAGGTNMVALFTTEENMRKDMYSAPRYCIHYL